MSTEQEEGALRAWTAIHEALAELRKQKPATTMGDVVLGMVNELAAAFYALEKRKGVSDREFAESAESFVADVMGDLAHAISAKWSRGDAEVNELH